MTRRALLVEGYTDTLFARGIFSVTGIQNVTVTPPKDLGAKGNGISNVIRLLPTMLLKIASGDYDAFAILVDADYTGLNGGFLNRQQEINDLIVAAGYSRLPSTANWPFGDRYTHPTQIPIHVGIFPDHANDGMVEDMLALSVSAGQQTVLHNYAQACIAGIPTVLFNATLHAKKVEISTLMAWQRSPGIDTGVGVKAGVFDISKPAFSPFIDWLRKVFP